MGTPFSSHAVMLQMRSSKSATLSLGLSFHGLRLSWLAWFDPLWRRRRSQRAAQSVVAALLDIVGVRIGSVHQNRPTSVEDLPAGARARPRER